MQNFYRTSQIKIENVLKPTVIKFKLRVLEIAKKKHENKKF